MIAELAVTLTATLPVPVMVEHPGTTEPGAVQVRVCAQACKRRRMMRRAVAPYRWKLNRMAACESGGRWHIATGNGFYGGLQFLPSTWWGVGGRGMPHTASELEQKYRAVLLIRQAGYSPWPVCGFR